MREADGPFRVQVGLGDLGHANRLALPPPAVWPSCRAWSCRASWGRRTARRSRVRRGGRAVRCRSCASRARGCAPRSSAHRRVGLELEGPFHGFDDHGRPCSGRGLAAAAALVLAGACAAAGLAAEVCRRTTRARPAGTRARNPGADTGTRLRMRPPRERISGGLEQREPESCLRGSRRYGADVVDHTGAAQGIDRLAHCWPHVTRCRLMSFHQRRAVAA